MTKYILLTLTFISLIFSFDKAGTAIFRWGEIETGTRALGMAGSQVASGHGVSAMPYNPANIGSIQKSEVFISKAAYLANTSHNTIAYATKISPSDYLGFHLYYFDSGSMNETSAELGGETGQKFKYLGLMLRTAYAKQLTDRLTLGVTVKLIRENTTSADLSATSYAFDVGSNFNTGLFWGTVLGMSITNVGPDARYKGAGLDIPAEEEGDPSQEQRKTLYFPIPLTFRLGIENDILGSDEGAIFKSSSHNLSISADVINPRDYKAYGSIATEYAWNNVAFVRLGTHLNHSTAGFSAGAGLLYKNISLDFAYADFSELLSTWQFGIGYNF